MACFSRERWPQAICSQRYLWAWKIEPGGCHDLPEVVGFVHYPQAAGNDIEWLVHFESEYSELHRSRLYLLASPVFALPLPAFFPKLGIVGGISLRDSRKRL